MLQSLNIRDFVIVDRLDLDFNNGFTVLTGETGAGKSILIDALSLALGARGEGGITRAGSERADIVASFNISSLPNLKAWLNENAFEVDDDELLLRRVIYADGRSKAFIAGMPSTVQQLREAGEFLVDIYSQHAHHSLLKAAYQRQTLDAYGNLAALATEVDAKYHAWHTFFQRRQEVERNSAAYADELADLRDQVRELLQLAPSAEEWEGLQQEHSRLANGASLLAGGEACRELLSEDDVSVLSMLSTVQHKLQSLAEYDASLQEAITTLDSAVIQLEETDRTLNRYLQRVELDPSRLAEVEARIQSLHSTARKYRLRPEELSDLLEKCKHRMAELESFADDGQLAKQEEAANAAYMEAAKRLSQERANAAAAMSEKITEEMQRLSLAGGRFEVSLLAQAPSAAGLEQVEFLVAGHAGVQPRSLAKVASGGELSRISLAIRVVTAQQGDIPTMIFDEVDVGIGGGVAEVVGQLLAQLGEARQILVITHLPQVASQGQYHLRVSKSQHSGQTLSTIEPLDQQARINEIARMLGGVEITETTLKHASEMLRLTA